MAYWVKGLTHKRLVLSLGTIKVSRCFLDKETLPSIHSTASSSKGFERDLHKQNCLIHNHTNIHVYVYELILGLFISASNMILIREI